MSTVCSECKTVACWEGRLMCEKARTGGTVEVEDEPIPAPAWGTVRKCSRLQWCAGMSMALQDVPENFEGKGLSVSRGWLGTEEHPRRLGVSYRAKARDTGIVLNFCPWCGVRIRFDEVAK